MLKKNIDQLPYAGELKFQDNMIRLADIKNLTTIDFELRDKIKDYIDDLVFSLYLGLPLKQIGFKRAKEVKSTCENSKFYSLIKNY